MAKDAALNHRQTVARESSGDRTFGDAFADVFTHPEDLTLYQPDTGWAARARDMDRIGNDLRKAAAVVMEETADYATED